MFFYIIGDQFQQAGIWIVFLELSICIDTDPLFQQTGHSGFRDPSHFPHGNHNCRNKDYMHSQLILILGTEHNKILTLGSSENYKM